MLDQLKRFFNAVEKEPEMVQETLQAPVLADNTAELASVQAALASQAEAFTTVTEQLAELTRKYEAAQATLAAIETDKASLLTAAAEAKAETRKEKLESVLGTVGAAPVLASLEGSDDNTFETVLKAFSANREAEAKSPAFQEKGLTADKEVDVKPVHFKQYINKAK